MASQISATKAPAIDRLNTHFHYLRYVIITAGGVALGSMLFLRIAITVSMVSMVNHTQLYLNEHQNLSVEELEHYMQSEYSHDGEFDWSNEVQEKIITLYMITYTVFQISTTRLLMRSGLRIGIAICLAICSITNILTPFVAHQGWEWVLVLRLINGFGASGIVPGMVGLIESWTPKRENAKGLVIYQFTGNVLAVMSPLFAGYLAAVHWKWAFYVPGIVVLIFCVIWILVVSDDPAQSKLISQKELDFIKADPTHNAIVDDKKESSAQSQISIPYRQLLKTREFYCMAVGWWLYCATSGAFIFLLPSYVHRVLRQPVGDIGFITFTVQIGSLFSMLWPNQVVEFFMRRCKLSLTSSRQTVTLICVLISNISILTLAYSHNYLIALVTLYRSFNMTLDTLFMATVMSQFSSSGLSGLVFSIFNSLGCLNSAMFCVLVGRLLDYTGETLECWSWVFVMIAILNAVYYLIYTLYCHSKPVDLRKPEQIHCEDAKKVAQVKSSD